MAAYWIALVPALPLLAAVWLMLGYLFGWNRAEAGEKHTGRVSLLATGGALLLMMVVAGLAFSDRLPATVHIARWLNSGSLSINFNLLLDQLSLLLTSLVLLISLLTQRFSINYLHREAGFQRFFIIMNLFTAAMVLIVLSGNAAFTFLGWELAGVCSYLLIGYAYDRPIATRNATRVFITNRIGDAGFILGLFVTYYFVGDLDWASLQGKAATLDNLVVTAISACFVLAALVKSAAVPFAPWIGRALEGPTSSSAIFYGALMVHAGIYLVIRLEPLLLQAQLVMGVLVVIGVLTTLYGFFSGLVQTDIKSALMFSTTGQIGLMLISCGLGWFDLATWHLILHAIWRGYQFLSAPSILQLADRPMRQVPRWLQRKRWLYSASLQRFWLDSAADELLVRPTRYLARELQSFDERVVVPLVGLPTQANAVSSLAQWEHRKMRYSGIDQTGIGKGEGALGMFMTWLAGVLHWFEEQLVLKGGGEGLLNTVNRLGKYAMQIEVLLSKPRYLWLMILATFAVII